ncbi:LysE family transporter [Nocardioides massiliensis]|uniref:Threonine/homoserine/homoserine lactone efflux protein n=1 Tax=Nocardioides massiliensis TaxID=1325935 RepID=A0ABT9NV57_9ACTN|nr:LysE family transporter [Nocardioides massiliensis]MDP9823890.1 threonine/homoserine/homoserine lactone efflux protein [Nocardioides massiliensis]
MDGLLAGLALGAAAGVGPGPLLVLVVTVTLRSGVRAGLLTAGVPVLSDALVVVLALTLLRQVPERPLAVLGLVGAVLVVAIGVRTVLDARAATLAAGELVREPAWVTLRRAFLVNIVSPHPWVSWLTVLGPLAISYGRDSLSVGAIFVVAFYVGIVGAKAVLALLVGMGRRRMRDAGYRRALVVAGALLVGAGVAMGVEFGPVALGL